MGIAELNMNLTAEEGSSTNNILKIVFIFVILAVTLFFGYFPLFW